MKKPSGFLNVNKPKNITSHDVIYTLRKKLGIKKIGHSGTLDPFATGVLVVGLNEATRLFEYLKSDKKYIAEMTFGIQTNTDDITGEIINKSNVIPDPSEIEEKIKFFLGVQKQKPPIFSAINLNGKRAYDLARENKISIENMKEREVEIYSFQIVSYENNKLIAEIHSSSGTYIRSIARDLGCALNTYGTLSALKRIKAGDFLIENTTDLEEINSSNLYDLLQLPGKYLNLEKINLTDSEIENIKHGRIVKINNISYKGKEVQLQTLQNELLGIGEIIDGTTIKPKKVLGLTQMIRKIQ